MKKKKKKQTNETVASGEKRKDKCKTTRIFRLYTNKASSARKTQKKTKNKIKLKTNKTTTKKKNKNVQSAQTNPRREKMLI